MKRWIIRWLELLAITSVMFMFAGCETRHDADADVDSFFRDNPFVSDPRGGTRIQIAITPVTAAVNRIGQPVVFEVSGGTRPYTFAVANNNHGVIQRNSSRQATYVVQNLQPNSIIVYDQFGHAAIGRITVEAAAIPGALQITADPAAILEEDGQSTVLRAQGGTPPYTWNIVDNTLGNFSSISGDSAVYRRTNVGDNAVMLTDNAGGAAHIVIRQP